MRPLALASTAALLAAAGPASAAPTLSLNGVPIDGVTGQRFENCTVVIDERGNVNIIVKGYAARIAGEEPLPAVAPELAGSGGAPTPPAPDRVTRRYFVVTEHARPGTQYDLGVFVNAQWIREVKEDEPRAVVEITKYLRPGRNKITLAATKRIVGSRAADGRDVALKVLIGEGNAGGDHVTIDVPLAETSRTAAEMDDRTEEFVIDAR